MKNIIFFLLIVFAIFSCSKNDDQKERNPYLTDPVVSLNLNLNLPEYNGLKFPGNYVITSQGIKGIVVYCVSDTQYFAYDLTDPNHAPSSCSRMEVDGTIASCPCSTDENEYNIVNFGRHTTEPDTKYPMQSYSAVRNGNTINISN
ncbi:MAG: hypothetical protein CL528_02315 [Aequorivita sp.]|jgi:hypothetical protein|nr:hypothetical protein [Aequorivita sp.]MBP40584.1 hypothetical protein [Aequorivita sp.]HBC05547.1 hypothetical protein [Aequorivita sp.]|tara:strand:+ start:4518 stop:4955 length:438 start_codon:yes stop_codon:yes gene_type:complete